MVLMLSWSLTASRSPRTRFDWLTLAPVAGRRTPAALGQVLDAPRYATDEKILRQNEKTRSAEHFPGIRFKTLQHASGISTIKTEHFATVKQ